MATHDYIEERLRILEARRDGGKGELDMIELAKALTRVLGADTTLKTAAGASVTTTVYQIDVSTGTLLVGGQHFELAALNDKDLLNQSHIKSYGLAGAASVAIADGQSAVFALCVILLDGVATFVAVQGAPATSGQEVAPSGAQCRAALQAAYDSGLLTTWTDSPLGLICGLVTFARVAGTVTPTHQDPATATNTQLRESRAAGALA